MTEIVLYALIALALLILAATLVRRGRKHTFELEVAESGRPCSPRETTDTSFLQLAERIFDPRDYRWLRDELGFPPAAEELARHRKRLAIEWLKILRKSFHELVRTPEPVGACDIAGSDVSSWQLLWATLRFHFLLSYAMFVVHFLGPYHQLIPSFAWLDSLRIFAPRVQPNAAARTSLP